MSDTSITVREGDKPNALATGALHTVRVTRFDAQLIEMEDVHFHFDSAVLLPDFELQTAEDAPDADRVTGLAVLRACLLHANTTTDLLLIAGHTDTSGPPDYNVKLSEQRAQNVLHALTGNRSAWVQSCDEKHKVEDYQQILKWIARVWEFDCDPGDVDNQLGPKTKAAIKEFQRSFNLQFSAAIAEDGVMGRQTWGAFFDVYMDVLELILETDEQGVADLRRGLRFVDSGKKAVGCGENFPIEAPRRDQFRSRINRRVELLFFNPEALPTLVCQPGKGVCTPNVCDIYKLRHFRFVHLPVPPITIRTLKRWVIRLLAPASGPIPNRKVLANETFVVTGAGGPVPTITGRTDGKGVLRIQVHDDPCIMTLKIAGFEFSVQAGNLDRVLSNDEAVKQRLHNMGYGIPEFDKWTAADLRLAVKEFQKDHDLPVTGDSDGAFLVRLKKEHGS